MHRLALIVLSLAVYGSSFHNGFALDDTQQVINNELTTSLDNLGYIFGGASYQQSGALNSYGVYYRPFMISTYAIVRSFFGLEPIAFHVVQWILHTVNGLLFFLILGLFVSRWPAFVGAAVFLVHPMNTESVSYIAALQDPLFAISGLLALWTYLSKEVVSWPKAVGLALLFLISLLSKETGALFIFAILFHAGLFRRKQLGKVAVAAVVGIAIYLMLRAGVAGLLAVDHHSSHIARADFFERLPTVPVVVGLYLLKFLVPFGLSTNQDWMYPSFLDARVLVSIAGLLILIGLGYFVVRRAQDKKSILFWVFWLLIGLGLHSQLINPLDGTFAERWAYFPLMGFIGLAVWFGRNLSGKAPAIVSVILIGFYGVTAHQRSLDWKDDYSLASKDIQTDPGSPFTQNNMGVELYRRGEFQKALVHLEKSVELNPNWNISRNNLGATHLMIGNVDGAALHLKASLDLGPTLLALRNYPIVLAKQGKLSEAIQFTENQSLKMFPKDPLIQQIYSELKSGGPR